MSRRPTHLVVCTGGDCRKAKGFDEVLALAVSTDGATTVSCQDICAGPVVGLERDGEIRWYSKIRGDRLRTLVRVLSGDAGRKALRDREARKRRGKLRRPGRRQPLR